MINELIKILKERTQFGSSLSAFIKPDLSELYWYEDISGNYLQGYYTPSEFTMILKYLSIMDNVTNIKLSKLSVHENAALNIKFDYKIDGHSSYEINLKLNLTDNGKEAEIICLKENEKITCKFSEILEDKDLLDNLIFALYDRIW